MLEGCCPTPSHDATAMTRPQAIYRAFKYMIYLQLCVWTSRTACYRGPAFLDLPDLS